MAIEVTKLCVIKEPPRSPTGQCEEYLSFPSVCSPASFAVRAYLSLGENPNEFASSVINVRVEMCSSEAFLQEQTFCLLCLQLPGLSITHSEQPGSPAQVQTRVPAQAREIGPHSYAEDESCSELCLSWGYSSSVRPLCFGDMQRGRMGRSLSPL